MRDSTKSKIDKRIKTIKIKDIDTCIDPATGVKIGNLSYKDARRSVYVNGNALMYAQTQIEKLENMIEELKNGKKE